MKNFSSAGATAVVSDEMAIALLGYVVALSQSGEVAIVSIPTLSGDATVAMVELNLGSSSQLVFVDRAGVDSEFDDAQAVTDIVDRTSALADIRTHRYPEHPEPPDLGTDFEGI